MYWLGTFTSQEHPLWHCVIPPRSLQILKVLSLWEEKGLRVQPHSQVGKNRALNTTEHACMGQIFIYTFSFNLLSNLIRLKLSLFWGEEMEAEVRVHVSGMLWELFTKALESGITSLAVFLSLNTMKFCCEHLCVCRGGGECGMCKCTIVWFLRLSYSKIGFFPFWCTVLWILTYALYCVTPTTIRNKTSENMELFLTLSVLSFCISSHIEKH